MKKVILFWLISTIFAAVMYAVGSTNQNAADLMFASGCVAYGIPLAGIFTACLLSKGIDKDSVYENFLFSWLVIAVAATLQYVTIFKLTTDYSLSLYYGIAVALVCGVLLILLGERIHKYLYQMNRY